jgi:hypothetical protein
MTDHLRELEEAVEATRRAAWLNGNLEGFQKGVRKLFLLMLKTRFASQLSEDIVRRAETAPVGQIFIWGERLVLTKTAAEVFDEGESTATREP